MSSAYATLPMELFQQIPGFLDAAQAVGRLACSSKSLRMELMDAADRLKVPYIETSSLDSALQSLSKASLSSLLEFRVDLKGELREKLCTGCVSRFVAGLGRSLGAANSLQVLSICLAPFDNKMERLRLKREAWTSLAQGFSTISHRGALHTLRLTYCCTMKGSAALQTSGAACCGDECGLPTSPSSAPRQLRRSQSEPTPGAGAAAAAAHGPSTFTDALSRLTTIKTLTLTHNEVYAEAAVDLAKACHSMTALSKLDVTRNHITPKAIQDVKAALPSSVELCGSDKQTFCW